MKKVIIVGGGGHAKVVIDALEEQIKLGAKLEIKGVLDDNTELKEVLGYKVLGKIEDMKVFSGDSCFHLAIGNNEFRKKLFNMNRELEYISVIHHTAIISKYAEIGNGVYIGAGVVVNPDTKIGDFVIVNTGSIVEHDCVVEDFSHISYRVTIGSGTTISNQKFVDMGTVVERNKKLI